MVLDPASGFIVNLPNFVAAPQRITDDDAKKAYLQEVGLDLRKKIQGEMIAKLLKKLHQKQRVIGRPNEYHEQKHLEPIFKICCCLMEKTLTKERRQRLMNNK